MRKTAAARGIPYVPLSAVGFDEPMEKGSIEIEENLASEIKDISPGEKALVVLIAVAFKGFKQLFGFS